MLPYLTTSEGTGTPNKPDAFEPEIRDLCAELGRELVRLCLGNEQPSDMCGDCAFRLGSEPNRSLTAHDALATMINGGEFWCHHGEERICAGYKRAIERKQ